MLLPSVNIFSRRSKFWLTRPPTAIRRCARSWSSHWPGRWEVQGRSDTKHEAGRLNLAWDKAFHLLQWQPRWEFEEAVGRTVRWYRQRSAGVADPRALTHQDIDLYQN